MSAHIDEPLRVRLLKLLQLAQRGVGGERINAQTVLDKLLARHKLTIEDIDEPTMRVEWRAFTGTITGEDERFVFLQVVEAVAGFTREVGQTKKPVAGLAKKGDWYIRCTHGELAAVTVAWDVYKDAWLKARSDLAQAFVARHHLLDYDARKDEERPVADHQQTRRVMALMQGLEHVERPVRRLTDGGP